MVTSVTIHAHVPSLGCTDKLAALRSLGKRGMYVQASIGDEAPPLAPADGVAGPPPREYPPPPMVARYPTTTTSCSAEIFENVVQVPRENRALANNHVLLPPPLHGVGLLPDGWVLALSVAIAARLGHVTSREARLDVRRVQRERQQSRFMSRELRRRREAWQLEEEALRAATERRRVEQVAARAKDEAYRAAAEQRRYKVAVEGEAARLAAERKAAKEKYELRQAALEAEYQARLEQERLILEEARRKQQEQEQKKRIEEEKQRKAAEAERSARAEEEQRARAEELRRRMEERKRLEKQKQRFAVRIEGSFRVERPPKGILLPGALAKEASVRLHVEAGSLLGGAVPVSTVDFETIEDAEAATPSIAAKQARCACDAVLSTLRLKAMTGEGPMTVMESPEQEQWMALAACRTAIAALKASEAAFSEFAASPTTLSQPQNFEVRTEIGVLPPDHADGPVAVLRRAASLLETGSADNLVRATLEEIIHDENEAVYAGFGNDLPSALRRAPKFIGVALQLAHFLGRMLYDRPAKRSDAPAWFEAAAAFVRRELATLTAAAPQDSLEAPAAILATVLGDSHPVSIEIAALSQANVSPAELVRRTERERARQAALAAKLLEEEWPDAEEIRAARLADTESKTPVAERVWALRNVAGTLALGGPGERSRARQMLEQAVILKQKVADASDHPSVLPELVSLVDLLLKDVDWATDAAAVASLTLRVLGNIAVAYGEAGDPGSGAALMEAGLRMYEEVAGVKSAAVRAATRRADQLLESVDEISMEAIKAARKKEASAMVFKVTKSLTDTLGAYQDSSTSNRSKAQEWNERQAIMLGSLIT
jgi:hypothetical protein